MTLTCPCADARPRIGQPILRLFADVRQRCPALLQVLLPPDAWRTVVAEEEQPPDAARHASSVLLAFEQGHLARVTEPVHRFLLKGTQLHPNLTAQYRQDLQERWLSARDQVGRHERARLFFGKVVELQVANWLADKGWTVSALEALGGEADIVAESPARDTCSFEVKYIGWQTDEFLRVVEALAGGDDGGAIPVWGGVPSDFLTAANYLLFKVYEAARRLRHSSGTRIAVVVIDAMSWRSFARPLEDRWIHWNGPAFLDAPADWAEFLQTKRQDYPELDTDLTPAISSLNHLWVFRLSEYECVLEHLASPATDA